MADLRTVLGQPKALIGMVHVGALPGTPMSSRPIEELATRAADEARILGDAGFDAVIVENMHDRPYQHGGHGPEITAAMTRCALAVRQAFRGPMGVQVLSGGEREALAVALAAGGSFIRVENFTFAHVADEGLLATACAAALLRSRRALGAEHIAIAADIKKKHAAHAITADVSIEQAAHAAEFFGADGVIVSGAVTGAPTDPDELRQVRGATTLPVLVGSGVTPRNAPGLLADADALIIGSWIKAGGVWSNPLDERRCRELVAAARGG